MTASHLVIYQIRNMIEAGSTEQDVAEAVVLSPQQVKRIMRSYDIRPPVRHNIPRPPLNKLMGGR